MVDQDPAAVGEEDFSRPEGGQAPGGGVLDYHDRLAAAAPFTPAEVRGRSGRGDTCTSAYLSRRLTAPPAEAVAWAAAVTSLKLEAEGPFRRDLAEVDALYRRLRRTS